MVTPEFQQQALLAYLALHQLAGIRNSESTISADAGLLAGQFIFCPQLDAASPLPVAASVAGAASLSVAASVESGNDMLRLGLCDFVVRSLDESLRILKNELRKKQPVSVVVTDNAAAVSSEMEERGVTPDLRVTLPLSAPSLSEWKIMRWHSPAIFKADAAVLATLPGNDRLRRRWISASPRFLPRTIPVEHLAPLSEREIAALQRTDGLTLSPLA